jgi:hypothetical protein
VTRSASVAGLVAVALLLGGCNQSQDYTRGDTPKDRTTELTITVDIPGSESRTATASCEGAITGTGYLSSSSASGSACVTVNVSAPARNYIRSSRDSGIDPRSRCQLIVHTARARELPESELGRVTIEGTFHGWRIRRRVDALSGRECDLALWKLMQPLISPSSNPLIVSYPKDS